MIGPILAMAAFGGVKAAFMGRPEPMSLHQLAHGVLLGPLTEEFTFRAMPLRAWPSMPRGLSALPFALAHTSLDDWRQRPGYATWRALDTGAGGLVYEHLYRKHGLAGAVLAHAAHNLAVSIVSALRAG